ncbi:hypothetical protein AVEN_182217-1 [Araneus ventricosus]|uniref:Uncharacterized protein n=1 Tax=Araneus ventricosus TaxID=182803 RepID=A0A4Y2QVS8_ARAVE|nr:hypothetical protein AVEN_182217-1 [Araneus ventricosus]
MSKAGHLDISKIVDYRDIQNLSEELSHVQGDLPVCENRPRVSTTATEAVGLGQCKLLYKDHLQRQPCRKNLNNNEDQNILWNEKCVKVFSPSAPNEFEKLLLWLDGAADNPYLDRRDDVGDGGPKLQQYKYRVSEQSNPHLTEENANFSFMNTSHENAVFDLSFYHQFNVLQQGNPLDGLPLRCLTNAELCASEAKEG